MRKALLTTGIIAAAIIAPSTTVAFADSSPAFVSHPVVVALNTQVKTQDKLAEKASRADAASKAAAHEVVHGPWKAEYGNRVNFRGFTLNVRTVAMVKEAEHDLGRQVQIAQGSYNAGGVAASAGTHDGGGVLDVAYTGDDVVAAFRKVGFAAWHRTPAEGFTPHIHAVAVGDPTESYGAKAQVDSFQRGRNGLAGDGPDTFQGRG